MCAAEPGRVVPVSAGELPRRWRSKCAAVTSAWPEEETWSRESRARLGSAEEAPPCASRPTSRPPR